MSAREAVLGRIRAALGSGAEVQAIPRDYRVRGALDAGAAVQLFVERVGEYRARVHRTSADGLPSMVAAIIGGVGAARVVVPDGLPGEWLADLSGDVTVVTDDGAMTAGDLDRFDAVITRSAVAIAETGTVVLDGTAGQGRRAISLVPDHHICVVPADRIVTTVPEGLALLDPGRALTMISGPSATSDIELDRVEGVHGPRILDVVVVGD